MPPQNLQSPVTVKKVRNSVNVVTNFNNPKKSNLICHIGRRYHVRYSCTVFDIGKDIFCFVTTMRYYPRHFEFPPFWSFISTSDIFEPG